MLLLEGKTAIVTGAARGIGRATAALFAAHGARVVLSDIDEDLTRAAADEILAGNETAIAVSGDVTAADFGEKIVKTALDNFGGVDIIVNNAGYTWDGVLHKMSDAQWQAMIDVHLTAPFRIIRAASSYLRETAKREIAETGAAKSRKIVNVSSTSGTRGNAGQTNYAAGKSGIVGFTKSLAREWGMFNIQVNAVAFGLIETRLTQSKATAGKIEREAGQIALGVPENMREMTVQQIPMKRAGTPDEAAGSILFFASPLSDFVSGQVLEVAGGM
jgi:3-oxoacyl-[acyl-carrier protein] reductase